MSVLGKKSIKEACVVVIIAFPPIALSARAALQVISNRAIELMGGEMGSKKPIHPNDDGGYSVR
jgi:hypothetical protein